MADPAESPISSGAGIYQRAAILAMARTRAMIGKEVLHRLAARSDIFVSSYRDEALLRMGLAYETLRDIYARIIASY